MKRTRFMAGLGVFALTAAICALGPPGASATEKNEKKSLVISSAILADGATVLDTGGFAGTRNYLSAAVNLGNGQYLISDLPDSRAPEVPAPLGNSALITANGHFYSHLAMSRALRYATLAPDDGQPCEHEQRGHLNYHRELVYRT